MTTALSREDLIVAFEKERARTKHFAAESRADAQQDYEEDLRRINSTEEDDLHQLDVKTAKALGWRAEERIGGWVLLDPTGAEIVGDDAAAHQWVAWRRLPADWLDRGASND